MSKRVKTILIAVLVLAGLTQFVRWWRGKHTIPVKLATVQSGVIEETVPTTAAGYLKAVREFAATATLGGRVERILKRVGDPVKEGEPIVTLDKEDLENKLKIEQTNLEASRTRLQSLEIKLKGLEVDYQRIYGLWKDDGVFPRSKVEDAYQALELARGELKNARAQVDQFSSTVQLARDQLTKKDLSSPFDGVLASLAASEGQTLMPNQPAFTVIDPSKLRVEASVDEVDSPKIHIGQVAYISPDAFPDKRFEGRLSSVAPVVSLDKKMSRIVKIEVDLAGQQDILRSGMSVDVEIVVSRKPDTLFIPGRTLLVRDKKDEAVWRVKKGHAEKQVVKLGIESWNRIEVLDGLKAAEKIIFSVEDSDQLNRLREGARVKVVGDEDEEEEETGHRRARTGTETPDLSDLTGAAGGAGAAAEGGGAPAPAGAGGGS